MRASHCRARAARAAALAPERPPPLLPRIEARAGVDLIKMMATGGVRTAGTNPAEAAFTEEEMEAAVRAAASHGKALAAHAHGVEGITYAARAGARTIEHCSWVDSNGRWGSYDERVIALMASRGTFVCPTVGAGWVKNSGLQHAQRPALERMHRAGVRLVASSDAGAIPNLAHHRLSDGMVVLGRLAGMSHAETLRTATSGAAEALGLAGEVGALLEGMCADVLVVRGDPILGELETICAPPLVVVSRGRLEKTCAGVQQARTHWLWTRGAGNTPLGIS
jgi:imidazolonepropionase-like amidohydrolase